MFEYSQEANGFGIVKLEGNRPDGVQQLDGYPLLKKALANNPGPDGDGGYKASGGASTCPKSSQFWAPQNNSLPVLPVKAADYFKNGAGAGEGNGKGTPQCSHFCGTQSIGIGKDEGSTGGSSGGSSGSSGSGDGKKNAGNAVVANGIFLTLISFLGLVFLN